MNSRPPKSSISSHFEFRYSVQVGLELGTFRFKEQNTTTEPRRLIIGVAIKNLRNLNTSYSVFSNFSQVLPISANFGLYSTNLDLIQQLFHLYDMGGQGWTLFQNQPFGLYLGDPWSNFENFCWCILHFVPYFSH